MKADQPSSSQFTTKGAKIALEEFDGHLNKRSPDNPQEDRMP